VKTRRTRTRRPANRATRSLRDAVVLIALVALGTTVDVSIDRHEGRTAVTRGPASDPAVERVLESPEWTEATPPEPERVSERALSRARGADDAIAPALEIPRPTLRAGTLRRTI
jgi:hypothetical protein